MVFTSFTSRLLVFRATLFTYCIATSAHIRAAASESSSPHLEKEALLNTSWWSNITTNDTSHHCKLYGITCNSAGSVTNIELFGRDIRGELSQFNFSCFANLETLDLGWNNLSGSIPSQIGSLSKLKYVHLGNNNLTGVIPPKIGNLRNVEQLYLYMNKLTGPIPPTLDNLTRLTLLSLFANSFIGPIPSFLGNLTNLSYLDLDQNNLTGQIPPTIDNLANLTTLWLSNNNLYGPIPSTLCRLTNLKNLYLHFNHLNGTIPPELGSINGLEVLELSSNNLHGSIPPELTQLAQLKTLNLSSNRLSGQIPLYVGRLFNLVEFDLSNNKLSGPIPTGIGNCSELQNLKFSNNNLSGSIPLEIEKLFFLRSLNLSHNNLSGTIPKSIFSLFSIDFSYNNLEGEIPTCLQDYPPRTFKGNKGLCGQVADLPSCSTHHSTIHFIKIIFPVTTFLIFFIFGILYLLNRKAKNTQIQRRKTKCEDVLSVWNYDGQIAYQDIIRATEDFDIKYCIGTGGYGSVYRAELASGKVVALKKLHSSETEEIAFFKSFLNEAHVLSKIRHRNIVKLYGFCLHNKCMFLIYEYMERGSLFCALRNDDEAVELDWSKRVNVVKGVAHALSYLHHDCMPSIIHRDISSNNILLNSELKPFVGDFGTARLRHPESSNITILAGTYGCYAQAEAVINRTTQNAQPQLCQIIEYNSNKRGNQSTIMQK